MTGVLPVVRRAALPVTVGALGLAVLLALQLGLNGPVMQNRLRLAVQSEIIRGGIGGVSVTVSGRDVVISPLSASADDVRTAVQLAEGVEGVRTARASGLTPAGAETEPEVEGRQIQLTVSILGGRIRLTGVLPGEDSRDELVEAAESVVGPDQVEDSVLVAAGDEDDGVRAVIAVVEALDPAANGTLDLAGGQITLAGRVPGQAARDDEVAAANGVLDPSRIIDQLIIEEESLTDADLALEARLADLPALEFAAGGTGLRSSSHAVVEQVAELLRGAPGLRLRVQGHVSSAGSAATNLELSRGRAETVRDALAAAGLAEDRVDAVGYGERVPAEVDPTTGTATPSAGDADTRDRAIVFRVLR